MKTSKPKVQKKEAKKVAKKELEKSLTAKFLEAVKHLGHDAEKIGKDIEIAGKFVAKKLSKKFSASKDVIKKEVDQAPEKVSKGVKNAKKVVEKAVAKAKPTMQSVKVDAIATEEKAASLITKPVVAKPVNRKPATTRKTTPKTGK